MHDRDCLHRFMFEQYPIRGHLVHLDAAWRALKRHREYPVAIGDTLGQAVAASLALARYREGVPSGVGADAGAGAGAVADGIFDLIGAGNLTVTLETDDGAQR